MPANVVKTERDEAKWEKAKKLAADEGHSKDWEYVMSIYQNLKGKNKKLNKAAFLEGYLS